MKYDSIPRTVTHQDLMKAMRPLLDLLGVDDLAVMADPGVTVGPDSVRFTLNAEPDDRIGEAPGPIVPVGRPPHGIWGYEVEVWVAGGGS